MRAKLRLKAQQTPESVIIGLKIEEQFTFDNTDYTVYSVTTALHYLNISMYTYIYIYFCKVRTLMAAGSMGF